MKQKQLLTLTCPLRTFFLGDLHGEIHQLQRALARHRFDPDQGDRLISVGDLIDRGADSPACLALLEKPWFVAVQGNHEKMMLDALTGPPETMSLWQNAGGDWYQRLPGPQQDAIASLALRLLPKMPIALEIQIPALKARIGVVHADLPGRSWGQFANACHEGLCAEEIAFCQWSRNTLNQARKGAHPEPISGIDAVVMGHTPQPNLHKLANRIWIDTGAGYPKGSLTLLSAEQLMQCLC
ncbi:metallophosphoesterase [Ferrimonas gelatinilytica]|uniref:Protein-serine/threonine phosphatase n=1 Tax=Ferrimonas gelatinilytica TaxID=1255257 RepID=A0ABP9RUY8_9GAMM